MKRILIILVLIGVAVNIYAGDYVKLQLYSPATNSWVEATADSYGHLLIGEGGKISLDSGSLVVLDSQGNIWDIYPDGSGKVSDTNVYQQLLSLISTIKDTQPRSIPNEQLNIIVSAINSQETDVNITNQITGYSKEDTQNLIYFELKSLDNKYGTAVVLVDSAVYIVGDTTVKMDSNAVYMDTNIVHIDTSLVYLNDNKVVLNDSSVSLDTSIVNLSDTSVGLDSNIVYINNNNVFIADTRVELIDTAVYLPNNEISGTVSIKGSISISSSDDTGGVEIENGNLPVAVRSIKSFSSNTEEYDSSSFESISFVEIVFNDTASQLFIKSDTDIDISFIGSGNGFPRRANEDIVLNIETKKIYIKLQNSGKGRISILALKE